MGIFRKENGEFVPKAGFTGAIDNILNKFSNNAVSNKAVTKEIDSIKADLTNLINKLNWTYITAFTASGAQSVDLSQYNEIRIVMDVTGLLVDEEEYTLSSNYQTYVAAYNDATFRAITLTIDSSKILTNVLFTNQVTKCLLYAR